MRPHFAPANQWRGEDDWSPANDLSASAPPPPTAHGRATSPDPALPSRSRQMPARTAGPGTQRPLFFWRSQSFRNHAISPGFKTRRVAAKTQAVSMPSQTGTAIHDMVMRAARRGSNDRRFGSLAVHSFAELDFMPPCIQPAAPQLFYMRSANCPNRQLAACGFGLLWEIRCPPASSELDSAWSHSRRVGSSRRTTRTIESACSRRIGSRSLSRLSRPQHSQRKPPPVLERLNPGFDFRHGDE